MTDAQWLLAFLALIYLSDCLVWLREDALAIVVPLFGRPRVRRPSSWAGDGRGGFAFTTLLPARAVFVCEPKEQASFKKRVIDERITKVLKQTSALRLLAVTLFAMLFAVAPAVSWRYGFAQIGLLLIALFVLANVIVAIAFYRTHARVEFADKWHRRTHAIVMLVATPSAIRAVDQVTKHALKEFDPLAVAARVVGENDATVKALLRELAYPAAGAEPGPRYEAAQAAGLRHRDEPPERSGSAAAYCPRCLSQYDAGPGTCADCELALRPL